ncbi:hypothetical protein C2E23DRAFT_432269 [Lenzites betulinus]|nr:hypothetical protein C2E23DRAFT_432269 [Lenzites betulinus]
MASLALLQPRASTLDVPSLPRIPTQCEPYPFTWSGGTPPYIFSVISPHPPPLTVFSGIEETQFVWAADIPSGFEVTFQVEDSTGASAQTGPTTMRRGVDDSCLSASGDSVSQSPSTSPDATPTSTRRQPSTPRPPSFHDTTAVTTSPLNSPTPASPDSSTPSNDAPSSSSQPDTQASRPTSSNLFISPSAPAGSSNSTSGPSGARSSSLASQASALPGSTILSTGSAPNSSNAVPAPGPSATATSPSIQTKHPIGPVAIAGIVIGVSALILITVGIMMRRRRRAALRPSAFIRLRVTSATDSAPPQGSSSDLLRKGGPRQSMSKSRFSASTELSDIPTAITLSSADAVPSTLDIGSIQRATLTGISAARRSSSNILPKHSSQDTTRNCIQEVVDALRTPSPSIPNSEVVQLKQAVVTPPPRPSERRLPRRGDVMGTRQMHEEDAGIRLAGGHPDEPVNELDAEEMLPPPYRRY